MKRQMKILLLGLGVIVVTNGVAYNRSGEPESLLELTERELSLPYRYISKDENSGLALHLNWRVSYSEAYRGRESAEWLTQEKLQTLGFDLPDQIADESAARTTYKIRPHEVFVVLEYDGEAHQHAVAMQEQALAEAQTLLDHNPDKDEFKRRLEQTQQQLDRERNANSRLFVIDAGLDVALLRQHYVDRSHYLILKGLIAVTINRHNTPYVANGVITQLLVENINVPLINRSTFDPLDSSDRGYFNTKAPRYLVRLAVGKRLEPWIVDVHSL